MSLETPTTHPHLFFSAHYKCTECNHETDIFLHHDYDFYNIGQCDEICNCCKEEKELICDGDLIMRKDWPDADNFPWQLQCAYIKEGTGYCEDCKENYTSDYKYLLPACPKCGTHTMCYFIK